MTARVQCLEMKLTSRSFTFQEETKPQQELKSFTHHVASPHHRRNAATPHYSEMLRTALPLFCGEIFSSRRHHSEERRLLISYETNG